MEILFYQQNAYLFEKEILGRDVSLAHQNIIDMIEYLDNKYGAGNWKLCFGRRRGPVIVVKDKGGTCDMQKADKEASLP